MLQVSIAGLGSTVEKACRMIRVSLKAGSVDLY